MFKYRYQYLVLITGLALLLAACTSSEPATEATVPADGAETPSGEVDPTVTPQQPTEAVTDGDASLVATLSEIQAEVDWRSTEDDDWGGAESGQSLAAGNQVRTGSDASVRIEFSDGTVMRLDESSLFTINAISDSSTSLITRLTLAIGQIFVTLGDSPDGDYEVETPSGVASVRGSYMSVRYTLEGQIVVACLEGRCRLENDSGESDLIEGEQTRIGGPGRPPEPPGPMDEYQFNDWYDADPESRHMAPPGGLPPGCDLETGEGCRFDLECDPYTGEGCELPLECDPNSGEGCELPAGCNPISGLGCKLPLACDLNSGAGCELTSGCNPLTGEGCLAPPECDPDVEACEFVPECNPLTGLCELPPLGCDPSVETCDGLEPLPDCDPTIGECDGLEPLPDCDPTIEECDGLEPLPDCDPNFEECEPPPDCDPAIEVCDGLEPPPDCDPAIEVCDGSEPPPDCDPNFEVCDGSEPPPPDCDPAIEVCDGSEPPPPDGSEPPPPDGSGPLPPPP